MLDQMVGKNIAFITSLFKHLYLFLGVSLNSNPPQSISDPLSDSSYMAPATIHGIYIWDYLSNVIPFPSGLVDSMVAWTVHLVYNVAPRPIPAGDSDKDLLTE